MRIRQLREKDMTAKEIVNELAKEGIEVSEGAVYVEVSRQKDAGLLKDTDRRRKKPI